MDLGCVVVVGMAAAVECAGGVLVFCGFEGIGMVDGLESGGVARTGSRIGVRFAIQSADLGCQAASARWLMSAALVGCWYSAVLCCCSGSVVWRWMVWSGLNGISVHDLRFGPWARAV